jgi:tetratricopeptide (TPR) repeat protein
VKSLYHLASCLLEVGRASRSLQLLERVELEDRDRNFLHPLFRHFAFGKVLYGLGRDKEAIAHLETAGHVAEQHQPTDFVWELAARCALRLGQVEHAAGYIARVPANRRRPYVRWTEADVLAASGKVGEALKVLQQCGERDKRSRHVSLIRSSRLLLGLQHYEQALNAAVQAVRFCEETYGNPAKEAQFWQAACLHLLGKNREAQEIITALEAGHFQYPHFSRLASVVRAALTSGADTFAGSEESPGREHHDAAAVNQ